MLFPSIDPLVSMSELVASGKSGARHAAIATRARALLARYAAIDPEFARFGTDERASDPEIVRTHRLLAYLRQPFLVAEPFTGRPGEWVSQPQLLDEVEAILDQ